MPVVSVIIPTYKHRDFVVGTLQSVFSQTFQDYEIIVVNDGSPDDTGEVLRPFAESGSIIYVEQKNGGQAAARNRGLELAQGEFVAFLDDDDLWPNDKLEWQVKALAAAPHLAVVGGGILEIDESGNEKERPLLREGAITFESLFDGNPFHSPGQTLIRTDRLRAIGGFDSSIWGADDLDVWFRLAKSGGIECVDRIALKYRLHPSNASNDLTRMFYQTLKVIRRHVQIAPRQAQRSLSVRGHRFVYTYAFGKILSNSKAGLKRGSLGGVIKLLGPALQVVRHSTVDPLLLYWMARDILPHKRLPKRFA